MRSERLAASLLFLALAAPLLPPRTGPEAPMACCLAAQSCECRTLAGLTRCPSDSTATLAQRLPCVAPASVITTAPPDRRFDPAPVTTERRLLREDPPVPPPRP